MIEPRYTIFCSDNMCGEDRGLIELMNGDFMCPFCGNTYDNEAGVIDNEYVSQFRQEYLGAKRGLIPDFLSNEDIDIIDNKIDAYDLRENK